MTLDPSTAAAAGRGPWRTVVVDDEPLARHTMRLLLSREDDFAIVAECSHGADAIEAIRRERPDVLFLDVQMPEVDGFEVLRRLEPGAVPVVIFVTAFDRYALQAFEQHALDYLLKPFSDERFAIVLGRTRERLRERTFASMAGRLSDLLSATAANAAAASATAAGGAASGAAASGVTASTSRQLVVRDAGRTLVIPHDDIVWIEAEDYCARIHLRGRTLLVRDSLRSLGDSLDAAGFVRVHRSAIANVACIREIEPLASGDQRLTLSDGSGLKLSRTYRAHVVKAVAKR
jgi:two-component system LytT family response regulator